MPSTPTSLILFVAPISRFHKFAMCSYMRLPSLMLDLCCLLGTYRHDVSMLVLSAWQTCCSPIYTWHSIPFETNGDLLSFMDVVFFDEIEYVLTFHGFA